MNEEFLRFGPRRRLLGTLTLAGSAAGRPAVLIPNTGVEHRIGPNRLHVFLSRCAAAAGFPALRIDLPGLGDSDTASQPQDTDTTASLCAAMDELERRGIARRFIALGICSGAHDAHRLAVAHERVAAAAFIDGYAYPTLQYRLRYWMQRLAEPERLLRKLRQGLKRLPEAREREQVNLYHVEYYRQPTQWEMAGDLAALMRRRLPLWFLYTGQLQHEYNYAEQLTDAFPILRGYGGLRLDHMVDADHTFSRQAMRTRLRALWLEWLNAFSESGLA